MAWLSVLRTPEMCDIAFDPLVGSARVASALAPVTGTPEADEVVAAMEAAEAAIEAVAAAWGSLRPPADFDKEELAEAAVAAEEEAAAAEAVEAEPAASWGARPTRSDPMSTSCCLSAKTVCMNIMCHNGFRKYLLTEKSAAYVF